MISYAEAQKRLILHEGMVLKPYICPAGFRTLGVGRNLETNKLTGDELRACGDYEHGITKNAALFLLKNDIERCDNECQKRIGCYKFLDDERQYALLDMCFQNGIEGLLKFKKMLYNMSIGDYRGAAKECLNSKYARQVPVRSKRIANLIETGEWKI